MALLENAYELLMRATPPLLRVAAPVHEKLARGVAGHAAALAELRAWQAHRLPAAPLVWVHAPSVGESLMAQAIIRALRQSVNDIQIAFTHFSPSAERIRARVGADIATYFPWDTHAQMSAALDVLKPSAIAFVRTELWPTLTQLAHARRVPLLLVNAVLAERSSRLRPLGRALLRPSYQRLQDIGAINESTARRFARLGVPANRVRVTGDARFDQVAQRVRELERDQPLLRRLHDPGVRTVVAGSTWPADEQRLLPAFASLAPERALRVIIAPHEPTADHLQRLEQALTTARLTHARLRAVESTSNGLPAVVLVDRVGVLADLYAIADVAYVGGGFHKAGVHSVVEPAALGVPVLIGPRHTNAEEAAELVSCGGARVATSAEQIESELRDLFLQERAHAIASAAARDYVATRLGGAATNAALIAEQLGHVQARSR